MKKAIDLFVRDFRWARQHLVTLLHRGDVAAPAHCGQEHRSGMFGSLVSHDRHLSGRLF